MSLFGFLKSRGTAPVARERLQILLAHERISVGSSNLLAILRDELLATIARHIEIDPEKLSVKLERAGSVSTLEIDVEVPSGKDQAKWIFALRLLVGDRAEYPSGLSQEAVGVVRTGQGQHRRRVRRPTP